MSFMKNTVFTGAGVALITPFNEKGVDFDKLGEIIDFQIENGTDSIVVCGTTGEPATMPDDEHLSVIEYAVSRVNGRVPLIAGTGGNDTAHCTRLSVEAQKLGVDALLLVTPYYNKTSQKGLQKHFETVADAVSIPMILYNVPSRTGLNISVKCMKELAKRENIVGLKEASGNLSFTMEMMKECGDMIDIYSGNDDMIVPLLSIGCKGVISVLSNVMPRQTHDICDLYFKGKTEESRKLQLELLDLINSLFVEVNPIPVKTAMNLMGMNVGNLRLPLYDMEDKNLEILKGSLKKHGLIK